MKRKDLPNEIKIYSSNINFIKFFNERLLLAKSVGQDDLICFTKKNPLNPFFLVSLIHLFLFFSPQTNGLNIWNGWWWRWCFKMIQSDLSASLMLFLSSLLVSVLVSLIDSINLTDVISTGDVIINKKTLKTAKKK